MADHKLVLRGFEFRRKDGTDANIRSVGVWLDADKNNVRVMLMDDQGPDFRGFEQYIGLFFAAGAVAPMIGQTIATNATIQDAVKRLNAGEKAGKYRPYAVTVQYAWIPDWIVSGRTEVVTGVGGEPSSGKTITGDTVLQGFEFYFTNSDHHLGALGIRPPAFNRASGDSNPTVIYRDQNRDDPKRWAIAYAKIKETR
jgi:hypothetical protein